MYHAPIGDGGPSGVEGPRSGNSGGKCPGSSSGGEGAPGSRTGAGISGPGWGEPGGSSRGGSLGRPGLDGGTSCGPGDIVALTFGEIPLMFDSANAPKQVMFRCWARRSNRVGAR